MCKLRYKNVSYVIIKRIGCFSFLQRKWFAIIYKTVFMLFHLAINNKLVLNLKSTMPLIYMNNHNCQLLVSYVASYLTHVVSLSLLDISLNSHYKYLMK